jgi:hypothetical protein
MRTTDQDLEEIFGKFGKVGWRKLVADLALRKTGIDSPCSALAGFKADSEAFLIKHRSSKRRS